MIDFNPFRISFVRFVGTINASNSMDTSKDDMGGKVEMGYTYWGSSGGSIRGFVGDSTAVDDIDGTNSSGGCDGLMSDAPL